MRITLRLYDGEYTIEQSGEDASADELKELFSRLLVVAGFAPSVIELEDGKYGFIDDDEMVVKISDYGTDSNNNSSKED